MLAIHQMALSKPALPDLFEELRWHGCPTLYGTLIMARDHHPPYVLCLGSKHAQAAINTPEGCSHCLAPLRKLQQHRLRVAATHSNDLGQYDLHKEDDGTASSLPQLGPSTPSWADRSNLVGWASPFLSPVTLYWRERHLNQKMAICPSHLKIQVRRTAFLRAK